MNVGSVEKPLNVPSIYFVRHPIFNEYLEVITWKLFFCQSKDGEISREVTLPDITESFTIASFQEVFGKTKIWMEIPLDYSSQRFPLPNDQVLIGVSAAALNANNPDLVNTIKRLTREGFGTALNDFEAQDIMQFSGFRPDLVEVNIEGLTNEEIKERLKKARQISGEVCASGIQSYEEFESCKRLGFECFSGPFLNRPWHQELDAVPTNKLIVFELLNGLLNPEIIPDDVVELISRDPRLAYKLLAVINSAAFSLPRAIESLVEAVVMMGLNKLRNWASLIALSTIDDKPNELMAIGLVRAKMCELLAEELEQKNTDSYFIVGLFSVLDAMLDRPLSELLNQLPIAESLKVALTHHEGMVGMILYNVLAYEQARWREVQFPGLSIDDYREAYLYSLVWSREVVNTIHHR